MWCGTVVAHNWGPICFAVNLVLDRGRINDLENRTQCGSEIAAAIIYCTSRTVPYLGDEGVQSKLEI